MVLKELILTNRSYCGKMFLTVDNLGVSMLGGCGGLERTDF